MIISHKEFETLQRHIREKRINILHGVNPKLVKDRHLERKISKDILCQIKHECGLIDERGRENSYHNMDEKYFEKALRIVDEYEPPIALANEIDAENDLDDIDLLEKI